ncbi:uncharacterized protein VNE69_08028 [Vairimorpha necatrix]|uniref:Uncharacterized protein n=1 Tax=Vairimorpha necatrix TaxID=6039 RepID=A0AAX4JE53_9MICR
MFFHFLSVVVSNLENASRKEHVQISEVNTENFDSLGTETIAMPLRHKRKNERNEECNEKVTNKNDNDLLKMRQNAANSNDMLIPLDLSTNSSKTENVSLVPNNIQSIISHDTAKFNFLNFKLQMCIFNWSCEDSNFKKSNIKLKFKNPKDQKTYVKIKARVYNWVDNHNFIVKDLLIRLKEYIFQAKIDENLKYLLYVQLRFFYEAMAYINSLMPFKKNFIDISIELKKKYKCLIYRIPMMFNLLNLVGIYNDFEKTFTNNYDKQDPKCLEILKLLTHLSPIFNHNYNCLGNFIGTLKELNIMIDSAIQIK